MMPPWAARDVLVAALSVGGFACRDVGGNDGRVSAGMPWVAAVGTARSGGGQGPKPPEGGGEKRGPAPGALEAEEDATPAASHAAGDMEESVTERLGFPSARLAV